MIADLTISEVTLIISTIVGGVIAIIGAVVAGVVTIRTSQRASDEKRQENQANNDKKLDEIHQLTNSNLSKVTDELAALKLLVEKNASKGVVTEP